MKPRLAVIAALLFVGKNAAGRSFAIPPGPSEEASYEEACREYLANGDLSRAIGACGQCLKRGPENKNCSELRKKAEEKSRARAERNTEIEMILLGRLAANAIPKAPPPPSRAELDKGASQQHYLAGVVYYQKGEYGKAREAWLTALKLNPENSDAAAGLEKLKDRREPENSR